MRVTRLPERRRRASVVIGVGAACVLLLRCDKSNVSQRRSSSEEQYVQEVDAKTEDVRLRAIKRLGELRSTKAVPRLIAALNEDLKTAKASADALGRIGKEARMAVRGLVVIAAERDELAETAVAAIKTIGRWAVPELIAVLDTSNEEILERAIRTLGALGPEAIEAVPALMEVLSMQDETCMQPRWVPNTLQLIGESAIPALKRGLNSHNACVRFWATVVLIDSREEISSVESLIAFLDRDDCGGLLRSEILRCLGTVSEQLSVREEVIRVIPRLRWIVYNDRSQENRRQAIYIMAAIAERREEVVPILTAMQNDEDEGVRMAAKRGLRRLKNDKRRE